MMMDEFFFLWVQRRKGVVVVVVVAAAVDMVVSLQPRRPGRSEIRFCRHQRTRLFVARALSGSEHWERHGQTLNAQWGKIERWQRLLAAVAIGKSATIPSEQ